MNNFISKLSLFLPIFFFSFAIYAQQEFARIEFDQTMVDLGEIKGGTKQTVRFSLENKSKVPLIISNVTTSCGCVASDYTKDPIKKGEEGYVELVIDVKALSEKKEHYLYKTATVFANIESEKEVLSVRGKIVNSPATSDDSNSKDGSSVSEGNTTKSNGSTATVTKLKNDDSNSKDGTSVSEGNTAKSTGSTETVKKSKNDDSNSKDK